MKRELSGKNFQPAIVNVLQAKKDRKHLRLLRGKRAKKMLEYGVRRHTRNENVTNEMRSAAV